MPNIIGEKRLTTHDVMQIAKHRRPIQLSANATQKINRSRQFLENKLAAGDEIYGVNTGLGGAAHFHFDEASMNQVQNWQIRSHASGMGKPMPEEHVRASMVSRINTHSQGYSACRLEVTQCLVDLLNKGVTPIVPEKGSVGASGDLAPMSHVGLVIIGEGEATYKGKRLPGIQALQEAGIKPLRLQVRDALALINGSNFICGIGCLLVEETLNWLKNVEIAAAMSIEGLKGKLQAYDPRIHSIRGFSGAAVTAANLRKIIDGSNLDKQQKMNVQDAYSLRSTPQVVGTLRDALRYVKDQCEIELNGAGDNPLFIADDNEILTGANFQGTPVGLPIDMLGTAITMVSVLSERRLNRLVHPHLNEGLPMFLTSKPGPYSGFMTSQYTADALITEQRILSTPASIQSIPASADQEDFVSMGLHAAQKTAQILDNACGVVGIEMLAAAQALDLREWQTGHGTDAALKAVRNIVPHLDEDRTLSIDHNLIADAVRRGDIVKAVEATVGELNDGI